MAVTVSLFVANPNPSLKCKILYTVDISLIVTNLELQPGCVVCESGLTRHNDAECYTAKRDTLTRDLTH